MADPIAVATKRAIAEQRLRTVVDRLAKSSGVEFHPPTIPANRFPDLYAAELIERVADFLERLGNAPKAQEKRR